MTNFNANNLSSTGLNVQNEGKLTISNNTGDIEISNQENYFHGSDVKIKAGDSETYSGSILLEAGQVPYRKSGSIRINGTDNQNSKEDYGGIIMDSTKTTINDLVFIREDKTVHVGKQIDYFPPKKCIMELGGHFSVNGEIWSQGVNNVSDIRFKENVRNISNAIEKLNQLNPVSFNWIKNGKHQLGFIAQEVEKTDLNFLVNGQDFKSVDYVSMIPLLVESVQELNRKIDLLLHNQQPTRSIITRKTFTWDYDLNGRFSTPKLP